MLNKAALPSSTELVSRFAFWTAWLGFVLVGVSALGILGMQEYVTRFFVFLPRLLVALIFLFIGLLAASFFSRAALLWAVNTDMPSPRLLSSAARVLITVFTASAVFEELGLADSTMLLAFAIVLGAVMLGLAIAFGLGGQDLARRFLEARFAPEKKEGKEREDELSPL